MLQVLVRRDRTGDLYGSVLVDSDSAVNADLLLDNSQQHVYVLTSSRVRESRHVCVLSYQNFIYTST